MRYSLANYKLAIKSNDPDIAKVIQDIEIGGQGSAIGSIVVSRRSDLFETNGYRTGAWVHNKNLDRTGTISVAINQLAPEIAKFIQCVNILYSSDKEGLTVSVTDALNQKEVATGIDCYFTKIPDISFGESAENQTWVLTCGQVNFN